MSNTYQFVGTENYKTEGVLDTTLLVEDGVVWDQEEEEVEVSLNYPTDTTLRDNNGSYLTCNDDTQYFSVLETSGQTMLNELNDISVNCPETSSETMEDPEPVQSLCTIGGNPDVYRIEGSDDLYAFEVACDEEGNVQKFRYRLSLNENGEYESVPESIELLPLEGEEEPEQHSEMTEEQEKEEPSTEPPVQVFVKQEQELILPDLTDPADLSNNNEESENDELQVNEDEIAESNEEAAIEKTLETKAGILRQALLSIGNVKSEESNTTLRETFFENEEAYENEAKHAELEDMHFKPIPELVEENESDDDSASSNEHGSPYEQLLIDQEDSSQVHDSEMVKNTFAAVPEESTSPMEDACLQDKTSVDYLEENESDAEDYQVVDGVHVTADTEPQAPGEEGGGEILQRDVASLQILKIQQQQNTESEDKLKAIVNNNVGKASKGFTYFIVKHPEKENVATITPISKMAKTNPRSLLKSSFLHNHDLKHEDRIQQKMEKKSFQNKEALQAKCVQNYIAQTTIIHAPIRQQRLPRKQTIKPVERADEEIIVQEMLVLSTGFVEASDSLKAKLPLKPPTTEVVQLTDSDDDYDPKRENRPRKKQRRRRSTKIMTEIVISDSERDWSSEDIVEIDLSDDSSEYSTGIGQKTTNTKEKSANGSKVGVAEIGNVPTAVVGVKKKRGRPPKRRNSNTTDNAIGEAEGALKKKRRDSPPTTTGDEQTETNLKIKWHCTECTTTFPSQGSLKTHMHTHNIRNLRQRDVVVKKLETIPSARHECQRCGESFKNSFLLDRHAKKHNTNKGRLECSICSKIFADRAQWDNHKRTHIKEQMFKSTTLPKDTPKTSPSKKMKKQLSPFRCSYCTKMFTSSILLNAHAKTHKTFACSTCGASFHSKLAQEDHIRHSCVKKRKLPSAKVRKSLLVSPKRASKRISKRKSLGKTSIRPVIKAPSDLARLDCDKCPMKFITQKALLRHKVIKHGLETADKTFLASTTRKNFVDKKMLGNKGVPLNKNLFKAYTPKRTNLNK